MSYLGLYFTGLCVLITASGIYLTIGYMLYLHKLKKASQSIDKLTAEFKNLANLYKQEAEDKEETKIH